MGANQKKLAEEIVDLIVAVSSKHLDIPEVLGSDGVIFYPTDSSSTVSGVLLLVPMSPTFGEPVSLCVNHRNTDLNALQDESEMEVVENGKHVIKKACIEKELYKHEDFD